MARSMPGPGRARCRWAGIDPLLVRYHDREWGVPVRDDRRLFEMLILEGAQAGLAWITILRKREGYRRAFDGFDPERIARYRDARVRRLLGDPGIVRNQLKIRGTIRNARAYLALRASGETLDGVLWACVGGMPIRNAWRTPHQVPARTTHSDAMSRVLVRRGFTFVGSTICYALMQAVGMVNDHTVDCFRYAEVGAPSSRARRSRDEPSRTP